MPRPVHCLNCHRPRLRGLRECLAKGLKVIERNLHVGLRRPGPRSVSPSRRFSIIQRSNDCQVASGNREGAGGCDAEMCSVLRMRFAFRDSAASLNAVMLHLRAFTS
jgi:hypothetical protein